MLQVHDVIRMSKQPYARLMIAEIIFCTHAINSFVFAGLAKNLFP